MDINFYLPDFYYHFNLNIKIIKLLKQHPEYFYNNIKIKGIYGSFPGAIWNGGRLMRGITELDNISATINAFNNLQIPIRYTFTNCLLEEKDIYDTYCNLCMKLANNGTNEVLVNSSILEKYLRTNFPNFKYILSTTKCIRDIELINQKSNDYELIVIDYRDNQNEEFLNKIKNPSKIEILLNAYCDPNCLKRKEHYEILSKAQKNFESLVFFENCNNMSKPFYEILEYSTVIKVDDLYNKYLNMGFNNFKIEGRNLHSFNVIESYIYYLVKPNYKDLVRYELVKECWK